MKDKSYRLTLLTGEEEARLVHSAVTLGDHGTLSVLLSTLGQVRRNRLLRVYKAIFGKKLTRVVEENLAGDYLHICHSILLQPTSFLVREINSLLMEFPVPHEELLIAMLCERSSEELVLLRDTYQKRFQKSLLAELESSLEPDAVRWIKLLVSWKESETCCRLDQAAKDTQTLLTLGLGVSYGRDGPVLASLISSRCSAHLRTVFGELRRLGRPPEHLLERTIPTQTRNRILAVLQGIDRPELCNARALWFVRSDPGRLWRYLLSVRLSRSKVFYRRVELYFDDSYSTSLQEEVERDSAGPATHLLNKLINV